MHRDIHRSAIRSKCIDELTGYARVIIVHPRDFKRWTQQVSDMVAEVERALASQGFNIINDEEQACDEATPNPIPLVRLGNFPYHTDIMPEDIK